MQEINQSAGALENPAISKSVFLITENHSEQVAYMALYMPELPDPSVHSLELEAAAFMRKVLSAIADSLL